MKYERLTNSKTAKSMRDNRNTSNPYYVRLAEIEDKIENGTLVELPFMRHLIQEKMRFAEPTITNLLDI